MPGLVPGIHGVPLQRTSLLNSRLFRILLRVATILRFRTPHKFDCFSIDRAARIR
jgi:hypothetical protein